MPSDATPRPPARGEDPRDLARELVSAAAAEYGRVRAATIRGVSAGLGASVSEAHTVLRAAVIAYAKALRDAGVPAEGAVIEVKSAVEAALRLDDLERRACVGSAIRWTIDTYNAV
jgi:hypothetical protein